MPNLTVNKNFLENLPKNKEFEDFKEKLNILLLKIKEEMIKHDEFKHSALKTLDPCRLIVTKADIAIEYFEDFEWLDVYDLEIIDLNNELDNLLDTIRQNFLEEFNMLLKTKYTTVYIII